MRKEGDGARREGHGAGAPYASVGLNGPGSPTLLPLPEPCQEVLVYLLRNGCRPCGKRLRTGVPSARGVCEGQRRLDTAGDAFLGKTVENNLLLKVETNVLELVSLNL